MHEVTPAAFQNTVVREPSGTAAGVAQISAFATDRGASIAPPVVWAGVSDFTACDFGGTPVVIGGILVTVEVLVFVGDVLRLPPLGGGNVDTVDTVVLATGAVAGC